MALEPPYGVQIQSQWTPLHVGLMPGRFGSINTSMSIPTFHSAVIRIQGLALNSAKMGSKNSAMCRSLRTDDRRQSWFCSCRTSLSPQINHTRRLFDQMKRGHLNQQNRIYVCRELM